MKNEAKCLRAFFAELIPAIQNVTSSYEIVCVDDGSTDDTVGVLRVVRKTNPRVKIIRLTRNFGKEAALTAGIDLAEGDAVIPIDADLQDPPHVIPLLVAEWRNGYDMVTAVRSDRHGDSFSKRVTAKLFYGAFRKLSDTPIPADAGDFRLLDRKVVDALRQLPERTRFMKGLYGWLGFRETRIFYSRPCRVQGTTKWNYWKLWNLGLEGIFSFSTIPLRIWTYIGFVTAFFAISYMMLTIARTLYYGTEVPGYASLIVVLLFFSGLNMIGLGILGEYVGRIFVETKQRPLYLIGELIGFAEAEGHEAEVQLARASGS